MNHCGLWNDNILGMLLVEGLIVCEWILGGAVDGIQVDVDGNAVYLYPRLIIEATSGGSSSNASLRDTSTFGRIM